jgi:hypothetical protein
MNRRMWILIRKTRMAATGVFAVATAVAVTTIVMLSSVAPAFASASPVTGSRWTGSRWTGSPVTGSRWTGSRWTGSEVPAPESDPGATGPSCYGQLTLVPRADGRVDHLFNTFPDPTSASSGQLWYQPQLVAGGDYGPWQLLADVGLDLRTPCPAGVENADGLVEVFFNSFSDGTYQVSQISPDGPWTSEVFAQATTLAVDQPFGIW